MIGRAMDRDIRPWLDLSDLADMGETASKRVKIVGKKVHMGGDNMETIPTWRTKGKGRQ